MGEEMTLECEIYAELCNIDNFEDFFIKVCELKVAADNEELSVLSSVVKVFAYKYKPSAIVYLADSIISEKCLPMKSKVGKHYL